MSLIPKKIYQSWKTKKLEGKMQDVVNRTISMNPDYEYELWDDKDCYDFLLDNFGQNYANAFNVLIPGAFKCDFWRYAVLYVNGGVYMDIDMSCEYPFRDILKPTDRFVSIVDKFDLHPVYKKCDIFQSFLACEPRHPIMRTSLEISYYNIAMRRYDLLSTLSITGPIVVAVAFNLYMNKPNTFDEIKVGEYKDGIRLFKMTNWTSSDLDGKVIFKNKYDGYKRGPNNYGSVSNYYKDEPMRVLRQIIRYSVIFLVILALVSVVFNYIFRRKWKECVKTCNMD